MDEACAWARIGVHHPRLDIAAARAVNDLRAGLLHPGETDSHQIECGRTKRPQHHIKGVRLALESMVTARHYASRRTVLDSLSDLLPVGDWDGLAPI